MMVIIGSGHKLEDCLRLIEEVDCHEPHRVVAVGVNCTPPQHITEAITVIKTIIHPRRQVVVYPNSGEVYVVAQEGGGWLPDSGTHQEDFADMTVRWRQAGATVIGGCCRTSPQTIAALRDKLLPPGLQCEA